MRGHGSLVVLNEIREPLGLLDDLRIILCVLFGFGVVLESILLVGFDAEALGSSILASIGAIYHADSWRASRRKSLLETRPRPSGYQYINRYRSPNHLETFQRCL